MDQKINENFNEPTDIWESYRQEDDQILLYIADSSNDAIRKVIIYKDGQYTVDENVETVRLKNVPSVVEVVKSDMVEWGEKGCKWVRPNKNK